MPRLLRITTVPISLHLLIPGQMRYMREHGYEVLAVSADGPEVGKVIRFEGVAHRVVPFTRVISPVQDLTCLWKLILLIREFKPDVVHTHTPKAGLIGMMAALWCGVPVRLHTVAGMPLMGYSGWRRWLLVQAEAMTYRCATRVYPNSHTLSAFIGGLFPKYRSKMKVLGNGSSNGIDMDYFSRTTMVEETAQVWRQKLGFGTTDFVWCFVGRLVGDKGVGELVSAFYEISEMQVHHHLILVGPYEQERDALGAGVIDQIEKHPRIHQVGFQEDVRPFLALGKVFVFPSYREGFPNVVLQAGAMGLPCIVTDINGCNEIVRQGENGLIVPVKDSKALVEAMNYYIQNEEVMNDHAASARESISHRYSRGQIWTLLLEEYKRN